MFTPVLERFGRYLTSAIAFMTLRHYILWDRKKSAMMVMCGGFALSYIAVFVFFIFTIRSVQGELPLHDYKSTLLIPISERGLCAYARFMPVTEKA